MKPRKRKAFYANHHQEDQWHLCFYYWEKKQPALALLKNILLFLLLIFLSKPVSGIQRQPLNITAVTGITVELKCKVKLHECGNFNGIEWYREPLNVPEDPSDIIDLRQRVYVYRHHSGISKPEAHWANRARHIYDTKKHLMRVKLSPLQLEDEGAYSCEITYEEPGRWFKDSCQDPQLTMLNVLGKPEEVSVSMENGTQLEDGAILGPYTEGTNLVLRCQASGGRPIPEVVWHDGSRELPNSWHWRVEHDNGTGSVQSEINIELSRTNLGLPLICKVNSSALDAPVSKKIHVNMEVAPNELVMERPHDKEQQQADVPEGGRLSVTCIAKGAKPQAYIYWNSEPELSKDDIHEEVTREDNGLTFQTLNRLTFSAQRELTSLSCFASNQALDDRKGVHLKQTTTINVKFKPEILKANGTTQIIHAIEGEHLTLTCNFKANPMVGANIKWFKNGHFLEHGPNQHGFDLKVKATRQTAGVYACQVENEVGRSQQTDFVHIFVEEKPQVTIYFEPRQPVSEVADANVTLMCSSNYNRNMLDNANVITSSNFLAVKWYLDGDLLKEVERSPECLAMPKNKSSNCHVDPSKVMLLNVKRSFRGNYSCQAKNRAGWGATSQSKEMKVLFPPEGTSVSFSPQIVVKDKPFEITCAVKDPGFPPAKLVRWLHNGHEIKGRTSFSLSFNHADVFSSGNYSCVPFNQVGMAQPAATTIRLYSAPSFVQSLPPVSGIPYQQRSVQLKCVIQCFPLCDIVWHRNGTPIHILTERSIGNGVIEATGSFDAYSKFIVKTMQQPPNPSENILEHVESTMSIDYSNWPGDQLASNDVTSYSCVSGANSMGSSVKSQTKFRIHYPPRNIRVEPRRQDVFEKAIVEPFTCYADAFPKAKYYWSFEEGNFTTVGPRLTFRYGIRRYQAGTYTCTAYNDLDKLKTSVRLNVYYKPTCRIRNQETSDGGLNLRCDVDAFPPNVTYRWTHNDLPIPASDGPTLYYRHVNSLLRKAKEGDIEAVNAIFGTFACQAFNIAGPGEKCSISIDGPPSALVADTDTTYLLFGGASVLLLLFIIITSIILCRRHAVSKYDTASAAAAASTSTGINRLPVPEPSNADFGNGGVTSVKSTTNNGTSSFKSPMSSSQNSSPRRPPNLQQQPQNDYKEEQIVLSRENMYDMNTRPPPPPPMYRRVPPPAHMMTLDRRIPNSAANHLQHQLLPNGCDVTLNRRHFNGDQRMHQRRRLPEDLWLV